MIFQTHIGKIWSFTNSLLNCADFSRESACIPSQPIDEIWKSHIDKNRNFLVCLLRISLKLTGINISSVGTVIKFFIVQKCLNSLCRHTGLKQMQNNSLLHVQKEYRFFLRQEWFKVFSTWDGKIFHFQSNI